jgi:hypothetical protein
MTSACKYKSAFNLGDTHYSLAMTPDVLSDWANKCAMGVRKIVRRRKVRPVFCYAGMSGVAHATALSMAYQRRYGAEFGMIYVRKPNEKTHGQDIEHSLSPVRNHTAMLVFVDDLVDGGNTRDRVLKEAFPVSTYKSMYNVYKNGADETLTTSFIQVLSAGIKERTFDSIELELVPRITTASPTQEIPY